MSRHGQELGEALAYLFGDDRDEPLRCLWSDCRSERLEHDLYDDKFCCLDCRRFTSGEVAADDRRERMRERAMRGVGAPLVQAFDRRVR